MIFANINSKDYLKILRAVSEVAIIAYTDREGRITYANENFCKASGYSIDELIGKDHRILNSGHHSKEFFQEMYQIINSGQIWRGEVRNRRKDGTYYWIDGQIIPIQNEKEEIESFASVYFDITERKNIEKAKLDLDKLDYICNLAKYVAHEVNNPLAIIELCCTHLNREMNGSVPSLQTRKKISKIIEQSERIATIVKELKSFTNEKKEKSAA